MSETKKNEAMELSLEEMEQISGGVQGSGVELARWFKANPKYGNEVIRLYKTSGKPAAAHYMYQVIDELNLPFDQRFVSIAVSTLISNLV